MYARPGTVLRRLAPVLVGTLFASAVAAAQAAPVLAQEAPRVTPAQWALRWRVDEAQAADAAARVAALSSRPEPADVLGAARRRLQLAVGEYDRRQAIRDEQIAVYALAVDEQLAAQTLRLLPTAEAAGIRAVIAGLRALWTSAGIDDLAQVHPRTGRSLSASAPVDTLRGLYAESQRSSSIEWTYLASINFIESDFGRNTGPSSAGAMGPMQFMPATWSDFGQGGDINSPRDSILAAGRYLRAMGGPANMDRAIFRYNNDLNYVESVKEFAAALRGDPLWLQRLYFWGTGG